MKRRKNWDSLLKQYYKVEEITNEMLAYGGFLEGIDEFDGAVFGLSKKEMLGMDSWQRLMLEMAFTALEDAGMSGNIVKKSDTGVFIGRDNAYVSSYGAFNNYSQDGVFEGTYPAILASRISNVLGLNGPSMVIDTSCSSALVALIQACYALRYGDCHMAIVGGINIRESYIHADEKLNHKIVSDENKIYSFDRRAKGTLISEGAGAIVIKPYSDAIRDGNHISAIIKGWAINNSGGRSRIMSPSEKAQVEVIRHSWANAGISGDTIGYIEAHGTGTLVGDAIELNAIKKAYSIYENSDYSCAVSTVKSNIGHTVGASGIASLIKAIMAMKNKKIPCNINFKDLNPFVDLTDSPIYISDKIKDWTEKKYPRRCGINSFGFSGVNCHIILEEALCQKKVEENAKFPYIFTLSAQTKYSFACLVEKYKKYLSDNSIGKNFSGICYTSNVGRGHYDFRLAIIANSVPELLEKLNKVNVDFTKEKIDSDIYASYVKIVNSNKKEFLPNDIKVSKKKQLDRQCDSLIQEIQFMKRERLEEICELYVQGANVEWKKLYKNNFLELEELPTYPMDYLFIDVLTDAKEEKVVSKKPNQPKNHMQRVLLRIFKYVLKDKIDIYDNFFSCGGDSIKALQAITAIKKKNICIGIEDIYNNPTVVQLADKLLEKEKATENKYRPAFGLLHAKDREMIPDDVEDAYPLTGLQAGMLFQSKWTKDSRLYVNVLSLRLQMKIDQANIQKALSHVISMYPILRTTFDMVQYSEVLQLVKKEYKPTIVFHNCIDLNQDELDKKIEFIRISEIQKGFDDFHSPPYRLQIILCPEKQSHIMFSFHHILMDGWGVSTFLAKLLETYEMMLDGKEICAKQFKFFYRNYVEMEQRIIKSEECRSYWLHQLQGSNATPILGHDLSNEDFDNRKHYKYNRVIDQKLVQKLQKVSEMVSIPLKNIFFTVHMLALRDLSYCDDVLTGIIIDGRLEETDGENVPGLYINTIPFHYMFKESGLRDNLHNIYELYKQMLPYRRYPQYCMKKDLGCHIVLSSVFNYTDFHVYQKICQFDTMNVIQDEMYETTLLPLYVKVTRAKNQLITITYQCNSNVFEQQEMDRIIQKYEQYIEKLGKLNDKLTEEMEDYNLEKGRVSDVEQNLVSILQDIMKVKEIDLETDFLKLNVNSISTMYLLARINQVYQMELTLKDFYSCTNLKELARIINEKSINGLKAEKKVKKITDRLPLTYMQQSMWKIQNISDTNNAYNIGMQMMIYGNLNVKALEESLNQIILQQEAFRMAVCFDGEQAYQIVKPYERYSIEYLEYLNMKANDVNEEVLKIIKREKVRSFCLENPPLFHLVCIQKRKEEFLLIFMIHHFIFDFWSIGIFLEQLADGYQQYVQNGFIVEQKLQINYSDYLLWDDEMNQDNKKNEQKLIYWRKLLSKTFVPFQIYTDNEKDSHLTELTAGRVGVFLDQQIVGKLHEIGMENKTSVFVVLLTLYVQQLSKLTQQDVLMIGIPASNRTQYGFDQLIGCCMDTLLLKCDLTHAAEFNRMLEHVREQYMKAKVENALSYGYIVSRLELLNRRPNEMIYHTIFNYVAESNWYVDIPSLGRVETSMFPAKNSKFILSMDAIEAENGIWINYEYAKELYNEQTMDDICRDYRKLVEQIIYKNGMNKEHVMCEALDDFESAFDL